MNPPTSESMCCFAGTRPQQQRLDERLVIDELNGLTHKQREQVYDEIHGVATHHQEETPEFIKQCCEDLKKELKLVVGNPKRRAYERAVFLKPSLENDVKFQLMFLRAERYDASRAARRLCLYFENKVVLFGEEKLVKDITIDDLDEDDTKAGFGVVTRLPGKDQSGRTVLFSNARSVHRGTWKNLTRWGWYYYMNDCMDEETQKTGLAFVVSCVGIPPNFSKIMQMTVNGTPLLMNSIPFRCVSIHFWYDKPSITPILSLFQRAMGTQNRIRFRAHYGTEFESLYSLMTFGIRIPENLLFVKEPERIDMMTKFISEEKRKAQEKPTLELASFLPDLCALYPGPNDVLLGRGRSFHSYSGNVAMATMMNDYKDRYCSSKVRLDKTFIAMEIHQRIICAGGRFLERCEQQGWKIVHKERGQQKVLRALRSRFPIDHNI